MLWRRNGAACGYRAHSASLEDWCASVNAYAALKLSALVRRMRRHAAVLVLHGFPRRSLWPHDRHPFGSQSLPLSPVLGRAVVGRSKSVAMLVHYLRRARRGHPRNERLVIFQEPGHNLFCSVHGLNTWRAVPDLHRPLRFCRPPHDYSANDSYTKWGGRPVTLRLGRVHSPWHHFNASATSGASPGNCNLPACLRNKAVRLREANGRSGGIRTPGLECVGLLL